MYGFYEAQHGSVIFRPEKEIGGGGWNRLMASPLILIEKDDLRYMFKFTGPVRERIKLVCQGTIEF